MRPYILLLSIAVLTACTEQEQDTTPVIRPIAWTKVELSEFDQVRTLSGIVASVEATTLSFEVTGKTESVTVNLGNKVKKDQPLAKLNQLTFQLSVQSADAELKKAQASHIEANNEYQRYTKLSAQGLVSQSGYDNSKAAFESTKSAVDVARAQLNIANKNLKDSTLLAPYDGIITKRSIEPSQQINAGTSVFEIEGLHGLEIQAMVPETIIRNLEQDMLLNISFPVLPSLTMKGHITEIGTRAESANAFPVTVILDNDSDLLRAGMTAEVEISFLGEGRSGYQGPAIRVPVTALGADIEQKSYVFVYLPESQQLEKRYVQTENIINNQVLLSQGLNQGEVIATAGVAFLREGQDVRLLDNKTQNFH